MRRYLHIPTVFGTATGAKALKRVKHKIHEVNKRIELASESINTFFLQEELKNLEKEKEYIIEKVEMIKANTTDYGLLGKEYKIGKN